jgi:hypothetical protein
MIRQWELGGLCYFGNEGFYDICVVAQQVARSTGPQVWCRHGVCLLSTPCPSMLATTCSFMLAAAVECFGIAALHRVVQTA